MWHISGCFVFVSPSPIYHRASRIIFMTQTSNYVISLLGRLQWCPIASSFLNFFSDHQGHSLAIWPPILSFSSDISHPSICTSYSFKTNPLVALFCLPAFACIIFSAHILKWLVCDRYSYPLVHTANSYLSFKFLYKMPPLQWSLPWFSHADLVRVSA